MMMRFDCSILLFLLICDDNAQLPYAHPFWRQWSKIGNTNKGANGEKIRHRGDSGWTVLLLRGGASNNDTLQKIDLNETEPTHGSSTSFGAKETAPKAPKTRKYRHTFDMILDLRRRSSVSDNDESLALRQLITTRAKDYVLDMKEAIDSNENKLPHPRKLLHYLAPKVPAIKQSPDVNLRIHSARSDMDSGVAACIIGTLAHVCEIYDKEHINISEVDKPQSAAPDLTTDRRFEQLVECVLNGVNVKKRKKESLMRSLERRSEDSTDIEEILDEEDAQEDEGLNTRDACRAAWGIAILGAYHLETLGGEKVLDLLLALSLRIREILLARLQLLRRDDLLSEKSDVTTEERLDELAEELAEDAVSAMWAFACVKACTGMRSVPLFETCCSILCQDPVDMRRRAQQEGVNYENGNPSIGNSDVIDRLARSETEPELESEDIATSDQRIEQDERNKDALLDWLSPTEVNDMLWALALHGSSTNSTSSDEITLSETASALSEIAFDRMVDWLEMDLKMYEDLESNDVQNLKEEQTMTVEVVDAAALLASEEKSASSQNENFVETMPVENVIIRNDHGPSDDADVQQVEVVDAAALLGSMEEGAVGVETEVIMAPSVVLEGSEEQREIKRETLSSGMNVDESQHGNVHGRTGESSSSDPLFSPHDLAGMAWAVTELRDPLRNRVMGMIAELVARLGSSSTSELSGGDLANLAWAISKYEEEPSESDERPGPSLLSIMRWVAHSACERVIGGHQSDITSNQFNALQTFQPPELGRLLWAIAQSMSTRGHVPDDVKNDPKIHELGRLALLAASSHLSLFAIEDLVRISWAFLEICSTEGTFKDPIVGVALGRILSTVEQSLHRWERGDRQINSLDNESLTHDASVFSSFFGKSRINLSLLEQMVNDQDYEDDAVLAQLFEKSHRPLLRDLSVDPSTLCKAACAFQRLSAKEPHLKGGWMLTRIAVRLLSSKDARLMRECSIQDIIRISEAAVLSDVDGYGRELITGFFARKVIQVLNEALECEGSGKPELPVELSSASPSEVAILLWSLGELGAKHVLNDEARHSAYKKMRLVAATPFLTNEQIKSLDFSSITKLFRGAVLMKFLSSDPIFLLKVLNEVVSKAGTVDTSADLCNLAESVATLKEALKVGPSKKSAKEATKTDESSDKTDEDGFQDSGSPEDNNVDSNPTFQEETSTPIDSDSINKELGLACDKLLLSIANQAMNVAEKLTAGDIRRLLVVYSLLPFQADDLIHRLEEEVSNRLSDLETLPSKSFEAFMARAQSSSKALNSTLFEEETSSRFGSIKKNLLSMFRSTDGGESNEENLEENNLTEELASMINASISSTSMAAQRAHQVYATSRVSFDSIIHGIDAGSSFELGRCEELIANYRRIEFSTGTRRSRYDKERRKDIAKRVLSRLLPNDK